MYSTCEMFEARIDEHLVEQLVRRLKSALELLAPDLRAQALPAAAISIAFRSRGEFGHERWQPGGLGRSSATLSASALPSRHGEY